ncbi:hypothetical protein C8J57DRAFT_1128654 [Mycena rebaudengoi]|nr:hypothetical protein C8J57DRAFT_1128654 [Mycena rebaudengoi]
MASRTFLPPLMADSDSSDADSAVSDPSSDIRGDFEDILQQGLDFGGHPFAFSRRYATGDAPNPHLNIDGLGVVGIPLSVRDARAIIPVCTPAPVNQVGVWEISSDRVHFDNHAWDAWVREVAGPAAVHGLRADSGSAKPEYVFQKLVVHEICSRLVHVEHAHDSAAKIGELILILPSSFVGGRLRMRHDGETKTMDLAHQSGLLTSLAAVYSGVERTMTAVTSGYRLSLVYDIIQPSGPVPTLADFQTPIQRLWHVMRSWKEDADGDAPQFLACLLRNRYAKSVTFGAKALIGEDEQLLSHLQPLALELGFELHLAHIEVTLNAWADERDSDDDSVDDAREEDFNFEDEEPELSVTQVVDLSGMPVNVLALHLDDDAFANGSITSVTAEEPDLKDFEIAEDGASLSKKYKRTVLLLWTSSTFTVEAGDIYEFACTKLGSSKSAAPTDKEKTLVHNLIQWCATTHVDTELKPAIRILRESAQRWNYVSILVSTLRACDAAKWIDLVGIEAFVSSYKAFGWAPLENLCHHALWNNLSNTTRWAFLARLEQMAAAENAACVALWCQTKKDTVLRHLRKVNLNEIQWLVELCATRGGDYLGLLFSQLEAQRVPEKLWISFYRQLHQIRSRIPMIPQAIIDAFIKSGIVVLITFLPGVPPRATPVQPANVDERVLDLIYLCLDVNQPTLCTEIAEKLQRTPSRLPWTSYVKITRSLDDFIGAKPEPERSALLTTVRPIFEDTVTSMISPIQVEGRAVACDLTGTTLQSFIRALKRVGGTAFLKDRLDNDMVKDRDSAMLQGLVRSIASKLRPSFTETTAYSAYRATVHFFSDAAVNAFQTLNARPPAIMAVLKFCWDVKAPTAAQQRLLTRVLSTPEGTNVQRHISQVLVPLMPLLREALEARSLDFQSDPIKSFAASVLKLFSKHIMKSKPPGSHITETLQVAVGCSTDTCQPCAKLKKFIGDGRESITFQDVVSVRTHVERHLKVSGRFGFTWETLKRRNPHTLQIKKPADLIAVGEWHENHLAGQGLLALLGTTEVQKTVLGPGYDQIFGKIHGVEVRQPLAVVNQERTGQKRGQSDSSQVAKKPRLS